MNLTHEQMFYLQLAAAAVVGIVLEFNFKIVAKFVKGEKAVVREVEKVADAIEDRPRRVLGPGVNDAAEHLLKQIVRNPTGTLAEKNAALTAVMTAVQPLLPK